MNKNIGLSDLILGSIKNIDELKSYLKSLKSITLNKKTNQTISRSHLKAVSFSRKWGYLIEQRIFNGFFNDQHMLQINDNLESIVDDMELLSTNYHSFAKLIDKKIEIISDNCYKINQADSSQKISASSVVNNEIQRLKIT